MTYRDIDKVLTQFPGATSVAVSNADFGSLANNLDTNATLPSHKKHIVYSPKTPNIVVATIQPDPHVRTGDIYVRQ